MLQLCCCFLECSTLSKLLGQHSQDPTLREAIGDCLILTLEGKEIRRNERHIIELHALSSDGFGWSAEVIRFHRLVNSITFQLFCVPLHVIFPIDTANADSMFNLQCQWRELGLTLSPDEIEDVAVLTAIGRITNGNFRLVQCLFSQIQRIMAINQLSRITEEVV
jgi:hypothetical protein